MTRNSIAKACQIILNHDGFRKYLNNTGWLFAGHMTKMILAFAISAAIARHMGPETFGLYNYIIAAIALITPIANLGIQNVAKRELISCPDKKNGILGTCFSMNAVSGSVLYCILMIYAFFINKSTSEDPILYALLGSGLLLIPFDHIDGWFHSQTRAKLSAKASLITLIIFTTIKYAIIYNDYGIKIFAMVSFFEGIILILIRIWIYIKEYGSISDWAFCKDIAKSICKECWPIYLTTIALTIDAKVDQVMLGNMLDKRALGIYSAAAKITLMWCFIPTLLCTSVYPAIVKSRKNREIYLKRLAQLGSLNALISYGIILITLLFSDQIIHVLYGNQYDKSSDILRVHIFSIIHMFIGTVIFQYINTEKKHIFLLYASFVGAIINVALNYYLIPTHGAMGAAYATLASQGPLFCIILLIGYKSMHEALKIYVKSSLLFFK